MSQPDLDIKLIDGRNMALIVTIAKDGTSDILSKVPKKEAAMWLRTIADQFDPPPSAPDGA